MTKAAFEFSAQRSKRDKNVWRCVAIKDGEIAHDVPVEIESPTEAFALAHKLAARFENEASLLTALDDGSFARFASDFRAECDEKPPGGSVEEMFRTAEDAD